MDATTLEISREGARKTKNKLTVGPGYITPQFMSSGVDILLSLTRTHANFGFEISH